MVRTLDLDKLFDKYIEGYVYANVGKVKPEEIEDKIPVLYKEFGDASLKELDGKTPNTYYREYSTKELLDCLKAHIKSGVPVSDFLCEAITAANGAGEEIAKELDGDALKEGEEYTAYLMNMFSSAAEKFPAELYITLATGEYPESVGELAAEFLCERAEEVKESALAAFGAAEGKGEERLTEVLSNVRGDDRVFEILLSEFKKHTENMPLYSSYLAKYGDERALPALYEAIKQDKIKYSDFEELRFAIEALGGEYDEPRDFTFDPTYKKICGIKRKPLHERK